MYVNTTAPTDNTAKIGTRRQKYQCLVLCLQMSIPRSPPTPPISKLAVSSAASDILHFPLLAFDLSIANIRKVITVITAKTATAAIIKLLILVRKS